MLKPKTLLKRNRCKVKDLNNSKKLQIKSSLHRMEMDLPERIFAGRRGVGLLLLQGVHVVLGGSDRGSNRGTRGLAGGCRVVRPETMTSRATAMLIQLMLLMMMTVLLL